MKNGLFYYIDGVEKPCNAGFYYRPNEDGTVDIWPEDNENIKHKIEKDRVVASVDVSALQEKAALKVEMQDVASEFSKLKGNTDYPLSVFVELLNLEKKVMKLLGKCHDKLNLDNIHVRR